MTFQIIRLFQFDIVKLICGKKANYMLYIFYFVVINFIKYCISQLLHFALKVSRIKTENIFEPSTLCKTLISIKKLKTIRLQWTPVVVNPDYFIRHENVKRLNCQPSFFNPQKENVKKKENVERCQIRIPDRHYSIIPPKNLYCLLTASLSNFLTGVVKKLTNYSLQ
jgi:uncharacterized membrane protein YuzA (DUF378 family)